MRGSLLAGVSLAVALWAVAAASAPRQLEMRLQDPSDNRACLGCHGDAEWARRQGGEKSLLVDAAAYAGSVHAGRTCTDCHTDIRTVPHARAEPVRCGRCHPTNDTQTVAGEQAGSALHEGAHSRALREGKPAPRCATCHGTHGILGPKHPSSTVHRANIPKTCGTCHSRESLQFIGSVHGKALAKGNADAAVCVDCHGEHERLLPTGDPDSSVSAARVPDTCSHCHESLPLTERHGIPAQRLATYRESYHGIVSRFGDAAAANCASCHGFHDILPSSDPESRVNRANLARTCGECHPGASENFARGTVHLIPTPKEDAPVFWVRTFYRIFIALLMAQFVGLILLDLMAHRRERRRRGVRHE